MNGLQGEGYGFRQSNEGRHMSFIAYLERRKFLGMHAVRAGWCPAVQWHPEQEMSIMQALLRLCEK